MGQKTHPIGFRLGIIKDWQATWFADKQSDYRALVTEDLGIRGAVSSMYKDAGISRVEIERSSSDLIITIYTARPGIVIGRGGQRVEELRKTVERVTSRRARLNVQEIRQPEMDAYLVARNVADQLERRIAFRRAIRQAVSRTMQAGAQGVKIICAGRLGGSEIARSEKAMEGRVPLHTLRADIDYGLAEAATGYGLIGVKVWICKGEIIRVPAFVEPEVEEDIPPIEVTLTADEEEISAIEITVMAEEHEAPSAEPTPAIAVAKQETPAAEAAPVKADEETSSVKAAPTAQEEEDATTQEGQVQEPS